VTVLALATGFDVPDVDAIIWCRPTQSPVLYVQGAGRGMRPAHGKTDCLWLDYSDTTERLGPVDMIRGRKKRKGPADPHAPFALCGECGAQVRPASAMFCTECGHQLREDREQLAREVSAAPILSAQITAKVTRYPVTDIRYARHTKPGAPDSMRVDYYSGLRKVASEWVCFEHPGFAGEKARQWWNKRYDSRDGHGFFVTCVQEAIDESPHLRAPIEITVNESGRWPEIIGITWDESTGTGSQAADAAPRVAPAGRGDLHLPALRELRPEDKDLQRV
jgi:DNA repair protein RadD